MYYSVEVTGNDFHMAEDFIASDLGDLAQFIRETIAYHKYGVIDTSEIDHLHIDFEYVKVVTEDGLDVTKKAKEAKNKI